MKVIDENGNTIINDNKAIDFDMSEVVEINGVKYATSFVNKKKNTAVFCKLKFQDESKYDWLDTANEDEIICPYCGYRLPDSYNHIEDDGKTIKCGNCGAKMDLEVNFVFTTTLKKKPKIIKL